jgi:hypothetical protein
MKSFSDFLNEQVSLNSIETVVLFEDDGAATTQTAGVALSDARPVIHMKRESFLGHPCLTVDSDTYMNCMKGKIPFKRWSSYIPDETMRADVQAMFYKQNRLLLKNETTGAMAYIK